MVKARDGVLFEIHRQLMEEIRLKKFRSPDLQVSWFIFGVTATPCIPVIFFLKFWGLS